MKRLIISPLKATENLEMVAESKKFKGSQIAFEKKQDDRAAIVLDEKQLLLETTKEANYDFLFDEDDLDDFNIDVLSSEKSRLNLSQWQRCRVTAIERDKRSFALVLDVQEEEDVECKGGNGLPSKSTRCHLMGPWCYTKVTVDDVVSLLAIWDDRLQAYRVDRDAGFCVINPDHLIAGTTVVGSLFCPRKAVLQERFRGLDGDNKIMVIGTLVHELLQISLENRLQTLEEVEKVARDLLRSTSTAFALYGSRLSILDVENEIQQFVPNVYNFIGKYLNGGGQGKTTNNNGRLKGGGGGVLPPRTESGNENFQDEIIDIEDIEENLWIPEFGLKGKIDVSVRVKRRRALKSKSTKNKDLGEEEISLPLELKTGRASFSMEHKGQLILYLMMLSVRGKATNSGLLLYLRENLMREIEGPRNEQRDLINLRNDLSYYLTSFLRRNVKGPWRKLSTTTTTAEDKFEQPFELPEPINHPIACRNCPYLTLCCTFARTDPSLQLSSTHTIKKLMDEQTIHLKLEDLEYFIKWCHLLVLEEQESRKNNHQSILWTKSAEERCRGGRTIMNLVISKDKIEKDESDSRYLHEFVTKPGLQQDFTTTEFTVGEYVIVSIRKRLAVATGFIVSISSSSLTLTLERNLSKKYIGEEFIVDKYESQANNIFNYTNLGVLLDNNDDERSRKLREIIIHRSPPNFNKILPKRIATEVEKILRPLNKEQRTAALKALTSEDYMLIKGLPGTGKTQTLVAIVCLLHAMGKSVVITSHTHSAVDNLLLRLTAHSIPFLRLGSESRVNPQLRAFSESFLTANCSTEVELSTVYNSYQIIGVTCLGFSHAIFLHRQFDVCIMDEATQVFQVTALRPLFHCKRFVLVGDPEQLPPLVRSAEARLHGADESLFHRLDSPEATFILNVQYRMNQTITRIANKLTYQGALQCANDRVKMATISLPEDYCCEEKWLQRTLQTHLDQAVFLLDTLDCSKRSENGGGDDHKDSPPKSIANNYMNHSEAALIMYVVERLLLAKYEAKRIGIIAPYRAHVDHLRKLCQQYEQYYERRLMVAKNDLHFKDLEINTVDQYQGRDKDIILYSCARTGCSGEASEASRNRQMEILEDKRRLTVAITRAKYKLIIVGDVTCIQRYKPFQALLQHIPRFCQLQLIDDKHDFSWSRIFKRLREISIEEESTQP